MEEKITSFKDLRKIRSSLKDDNSLNAQTQMTIYYIRHTIYGVL